MFLLLKKQVQEGNQLRVIITQLKNKYIPGFYGAMLLFLRTSGAKTVPFSLNNVTPICIFGA